MWRIFDVSMWRSFDELPSGEFLMSLQVENFDYLLMWRIFDDI